MPELLHHSHQTGPVFFGCWSEVFQGSRVDSVSEGQPLLLNAGLVNWGCVGQHDFQLVGEIFLLFSLEPLSLFVVFWSWGVLVGRI